MTFDLLTAGLFGSSSPSAAADGLPPRTADARGARAAQPDAGTAGHCLLTAESPFAVLLDSAATPGSAAAAPAWRAADLARLPARPARAATASPDEQDVIERHDLPPAPPFSAEAVKGDLLPDAAQAGAQASAQIGAQAAALAAAAQQAAPRPGPSANGLTPARARLLHSESPVTANVNAPTVSATPPAAPDAGWADPAQQAARAQQAALSKTAAAAGERRAAQAEESGRPVRQEGVAKGRVKATSIATPNTTSTATRAAAAAAHAAEAAPSWRATERQTAAHRATRPSTADEPSPAPAAEVAAAAQSSAQDVRAAHAAAARRDGQADGAPSRPASRPAAATGESHQAARPTAPPAAAAPVTAERLFTRTLATSTRLDQAARAGKLGDEQAPAARPEPRAARPAEPTAATGLPTAPAAPTPTEAAAPRPAAPAGPAAPALPPEPPQTALSGAILPGAAHLRLESETLGDLALHLRVREGVAHLRVEGEQAAQLASRAPELQRALAAEGIQLGKLEVERPGHSPAPPPAAGTGRAGADAAGQQGREAGQQDRPEPPGAPAHAAATPSRRAAGRTTAHHVEA